MTASPSACCVTARAAQRLLGALDPDQRTTRAYRITATDTKILIDSAGRLAFSSIGPTDLGVLRSEIEKAFRTQ